MQSDKITQGEIYAKRGDIEGLSRIIALVSPDSEPETHNYLTAYMHFLKGELPEALRHCDRSDPDLAYASTRDLMCKILLLKATILRRQGEYAHSNRVLDRSFRIAERDNDMLGDIWNARGVNYWMLGKFELAKQCYRKACHISKTSENVSLFLKSSINLGLVPLHQGNFFEANVYLNNARELCRREHEKRLELYALLNLGELCWKSGEWQEAERMLTECRQSAIEASLKYEEGAACWLLGNVFRDNHAYDQARVLYNDAFRLLEASTSYAEQLYVYLHSGILERLQNKNKKALDLLHRAQAIMNDTGERLDEGYLLIEMGIVLWQMGEIRSAVKYLHRGIEKTRNRKFEQAIGELLLHCLTRETLGAKDRRFEHLIRRCWKSGFDTIFLRNRDVLLPVLCEYVMNRKRSTIPRMFLLRLVTKNDRLLQFILDHSSIYCQEAALTLISRLRIEQFKPAVQQRIWDLTPRIAKQAVATLESLEQKNLPSLHITLFGRFGAYVDGRTVITIKRKKVEDLLKILLLYFDQSILAEQIMELLWPNVPPANSFNSLRQTVFLLRRVFREYGFSSDTVIHRETGSYAFRYPAQRLSIDLVQFRQDMKQADFLWGGSDRDGAYVLYEKAVACYQGPLLTENRYDEWSRTYRLEARDMCARALSRMYEVLLAANKIQAESLLDQVVHIDPEIGTIITRI